jgi:hypothetical protein
MSKIFEWDAQDGSYIARTGQIGINTSIKFNRTEKGHTLITQSSSSRLVFNGTYFTGDFTAILSFKYTSAAGYLLKNTTGANGFSVYNYANGVVGVTFASAIDSLGPDTGIAKGKWGNICITRKGDIAKFYADGILKQTVSGIAARNCTYNSFTIGADSSGIKGHNYVYCLYHDNALSDLEYFSFYKDWYIKFINSKSSNLPTIFQPNLSIFKQTEVKETGLITAYNFNPINGKIINVAWDNPANGYNARQYDRTITKVKTNKDGVQYNSLSTTQSINLGNVQSLQYIIKPIILNQTLAKLNSSSSISITSDGGIDITGVSTETVYINGSISGVIVANTWNTVSITLSSVLNADDYILGNLNYSGYINNEKIFNRIISRDEVKLYHNSFASKVVLQEDFKQYAVDNTRIGNWQVKSGGFIISEDSQGKYLKCTDNGVIQISLIDSDNLNTKSYIGTMTLSKTSSLTKLTATTNQICRLIKLTQLSEV